MRNREVSALRLPRRKVRAPNVKKGFFEAQLPGRPIEAYIITARTKEPTFVLL